MNAGFVAAWIIRLRKEEKARRERTEDTASPLVSTGEPEQAQGPQVQAMTPNLTMYAWVGEDELGSGVVGLKQAMVPAGMVPLAAMGHHLDRLTKLAPAMELQARQYGKKIRLVKFEAVEVVDETKAGS
jgi:hypothetical protein